MSGLALQFEALRAALEARDDPEEQEHERILREAQATESFAQQVVNAYDQQVFHRGHRDDYGLTRDYLDYARCTISWARYEAQVARWMHVGDHRAALAHSMSNAAIVTPEETAMLATRPEQPDGLRPLSSMPRPPHWPAEPHSDGAIGEFFAAMSRDFNARP